MNLICQFTHEAWGPHPGCKEFMDEPEIYQCGQPATGIIVEIDHAPPIYGGTTVEIMYVCQEHRWDEGEDDWHWMNSELIFAS